MGVKFLAMKQSFGIFFFLAFVANSVTAQTPIASAHCYFDEASLLAIVEYDNDQTEIFGVVNGLAPNSVYGFRVHEFGDLSNGCTSCGDNFGHKGGNIFSNLINKLSLCRN